MATIAAQRHLANSFHLTIDELEGVIKSTAHPSKEDLEKWSQTISELRSSYQVQRDEMKILADKVYEMVLKSATSKCDRLEVDVATLLQCV